MPSRRPDLVFCNRRIADGTPRRRLTEDYLVCTLRTHVQSYVLLACHRNWIIIIPKKLQQAVAYFFGFEMDMSLFVSSCVECANFELVTLRSNGHSWKRLCNRRSYSEIKRHNFRIQAKPIVLIHTEYTVRWFYFNISMFYVPYVSFNSLIYLGQTLLQF